MKPAAVLFDMDGTLVDSEILWDTAIDELAVVYGSELPTEARLAMVGRSVPESMVIFHEGIGQPWRGIQESSDWIYDRVAGLFATDLRWRPGAQELLEELRAAGVPTALVTSTNRNVVEIALGTLGRDNFDAVVCGDEVAFTKPHPEPYEKAAAMLGVDPARCVVVEDSPSGAASGRAAGARVLGVPHAVPLAPGERTVLVSTLAGLTLADLIALPW